MNELIEYCCDELDELKSKVKKGGKLSVAETEYMDTLAHAKKNLLKGEEMSGDDGYSMTGYSRRGGYSMRDSYADDRSYRAADGVSNYVRPDGSYADGGMSYARGRGAGAKRDSMGRYSRADDEIVMGLERLMDTATDEHTRKEIRKLIEQM